MRVVEFSLVASEPDIDADAGPLVDDNSESIAVTDSRLAALNTHGDEDSASTCR